jgi:hypothetical protein
MEQAEAQKAKDKKKVNSSFIKKVQFGFFVLQKIIAKKLVVVTLSRTGMTY